MVVNTLQTIWSEELSPDAALHDSSPVTGDMAGPSSRLSLLIFPTNSTRPERGQRDWITDAFILDFWGSRLSRFCLETVLHVALAVPDSLDSTCLCLLVLCHTAA